MPAVLVWRNHPDVRAASLHQHVISAQEHRSWWASTMSDPSRRVLIYEREDNPSGVVTFFDHDLATQSASWGYYLDVVGLDERGQTLLAWFEVQRQAVQYAFDELGLDVLEGEVLASNQAVRRLNRRQRFAEVETYQRDIDGTPTDVIRIRLTAAQAKSSAPRNREKT